MKTLSKRLLISLHLEIMSDFAVQVGHPLEISRDSLKMAADCVCVALIHSRVSQCRIFGYFPQCQVNSV